MNLNPYSRIWLIFGIKLNRYIVICMVDFVCLSVISYIILSLLWISGDLSSLSANSNLLYELNWLTIYTNPHKISTINLQIWMRTWPKMASRVTSLLSIDILYQTYPKSNFPDTLKPPSAKSKLSKINCCPTSSLLDSSTVDLLISRG